jgi:hypothetical protein
VEQYLVAIEALCITALTPARTVSFLRDLAKEFAS